jgi:hypothetical protein
MDEMFEELNDFYMGDHEGRNDINGKNNNNTQQQQLINIIEAELLFYKEEPTIRLYNKGEGMRMV